MIDNNFYVYNNSFFLDNYVMRMNRRFLKIFKLSTIDLMFIRLSVDDSVMIDVF